MEIEIKHDSAIVIPRIKFTGPKGSREVDLILDTGAIYSAISWDLAKDIGYDPARAKNTTPIITVNGVIEVPLFRVRSISVAELETKFICVVAHDIPEIVEVEGLLGLNFLQHFKTTIDYKSGFLKIEKSVKGSMI